MAFELQTSRFDQLLRRLGDLKGPGSKVAASLEDLFPTLDVEQVPAELLFLGGTKIAFGDASAQSAAAKLAGVKLINPADSGHLITVTQVVAFQSVDTVYSLGLSTAAEDTNATTGLRDSRTGTDVQTVGIVSAFADTSVPAPNVSYSQLADTTLIVTDPNAVAVLAPNTSLFLVSNTTNTLLQAGFYWRERQAEPSELNF